jgi:hypothetical protein
MTLLNQTIQLSLDFKFLLNLVLQLSQEHKQLLISILQKDMQQINHSPATPLQITTHPTTPEIDSTDSLTDEELLEMVKKLG